MTCVSKQSAYIVLLTLGARDSVKLTEASTEATVIIVTAVKDNFIVTSVCMVYTYIYTFMHKYTDYLYCAHFNK